MSFEATPPRLSLPESLDVAIVRLLDVPVVRLLDVATPTSPSPEFNSGLGDPERFSLEERRPSEGRAREGPGWRW